MSGVTATTNSPQPDPGSLISTTPAPVVDPAATPAVVDPAAAPTEPAKVETPAVEPVVLTADHIKLPEGFTLPDADRDSFLGIMNDQALKPEERVQKLIDFAVEREKNAHAAQEKAWADTQAEWVTATKADPEVGGDKLEPALGAIAQLTQKYGSPELLEVFTLTGAGNNVHMVKFLSKIAKDLAEGTPVSGAPATGQKSLANSLFPSMK